MNGTKLLNGIRQDLYCERTYGISSLKLIEEALHIVANRNSYHPVRDFLNSLEWDGQERIRFALRHFLGADASDYTYEILKFFMRKNTASGICRKDSASH